MNGNVAELQSRGFSYLSRLFLSSGVVYFAAIPAGAASARFINPAAGNAVVLPTIDALGALRIVAAQGGVQDPAETGNLRLDSGSIILCGANVQAVNIGDAPVYQILTSYGNTWGLNQEILLYSQDLALSGGQPFKVGLNVAIQNTGGAALQPSGYVSVLFEIWRQSPMVNR